MKKLTYTLLIIFIVGWIGSAVANAASGLQYLQSRQASNGVIGATVDNGWAVMALAAHNQVNAGAVEAMQPVQVTLADRSATDIERQILALVASGQNPRTFAGVDAVALLKSRATANQIGDPDFINDDSFGLLAYKAAGEQIPSGIIQGIITNQNSDGGWGLTVGGQSSTDMTAITLIALKGTGVSDSVITKGRDFIHSKQNNDGGFSTFTGESSLGSTAWVDWMLVSLGENYGNWTKNDKTSRDYIISLQNTNGSWFDSVLLTSYSLIALSGNGFPVPRVVSVPSPTLPPAVSPSPSPTLSPSPVVSVAPSVTPLVSPSAPSSPSPLPSVSPSPVFTATVVPHPSPTMSSVVASPIASPSPVVSPTLSPHAATVHTTSPHPSPSHSSLVGGALLSVPAAQGAPTPSPAPAASVLPSARPAYRLGIVPPFNRLEPSPSVSPVASLSVAEIVPLVTSSPGVTSELSKWSMSEEWQKPYGPQIIIGFILLFLNIGATILEVYSVEKRALNRKSTN